MLHAEIIIVTHPACVKHDTGAGHPERPARLTAIMDMLARDLPGLAVIEAAPTTNVQIARAHTLAHMRTLEERAPAEGRAYIDFDTVISPWSATAARLAAGAGVTGVDMVMAQKANAVFCAVRPPGHHACREQAMGFCLLSNAYIAARHAVAAHGLSRVAIVDFDVHHGNGTADMIYKHGGTNVFYASTHQSPFYPGTGDPAQDGDAGGMILNVPLPAGTGGDAFHAAYQKQVIPALQAYKPELLIFSAGFDAHKDDPLGGMRLEAADFGRVTADVTRAVRGTSRGTVSMLEGGYDLAGLAAGVKAHLEALQSR